ncbi:unnamed protein product [Effrenium voratum]|nr:unnamed protein product [Effrenium voratum]
MANVTVVEEARICEPGGSGQWLPFGGDWELELNPRVRMVLYFIGMIYSFMGVSIVADLFMSAIERVTSVQRCVQIGTSKRFRTSPVWNETVATLTLMALGSSAPEIMLSLNDIVKRTFVQGKLGASTIVGSAAFNLFVIIAVCINAIPAGWLARPKLPALLSRQTCERAMTAEQPGYIPACPDEGDIERFAEEVEAAEPGSAQRALALANWAAALGAGGQEAQALEASQQALEAFEDLGPKACESPGYASSAVNVGDHLNELGRHDEAMELFEKAHQVYLAAGWERTLNYAVVLHNLGNCCFKQGRAAPAMEHYRQALSAYEAVVLGEESPQYAELLEVSFIPKILSWFEIMSEVRQIKQRGVYGLTAFFSIFAYVWLLFICVVSSIDEIELWEGIVTFLYFPTFVTVCYLADVGVLTAANIRQKLCPRRSEEEENGPKTWLEKFKVENFKEEDLDPEEKQRREEEERKREAARMAKERELGHGPKGRRARLCQRLRCCRRNTKSQEVEEPEDLEPLEQEEENTYLSDPSILLLDDDGNPLENEYGIITFSKHSLTIRASEEEQQIPVQVVRKNGNEGKVTCTYRLEQLSAIPGFDYEEDEGEVQFRDGVQVAELTLSILPKKRGERSDRFQVVLEEPTGGAEFNPDFDGGEECQRLTVIVENEIRGGSCLTMAIDSIVNLDELRQGTALWRDQVLEAIYVGGSREEQEQAGALDWLSHLIWLPWNFTFSMMTPPPAYLGGWVCFFISLMHIAWLTIIIGDLAELFGCVANVDDNITAISFVALGTSVPDLFASMTAAKQDPNADASIVNVTGSNSVNVFLGIGMPWLLASFYWYLQGGKFAVKSQGMSFSVLVFTCGACVTLTVIEIRRWRYHGELGGPEDAKAYSSFLLVVLWMSYIGLSVWKFENMEAPLTQDLMVLGVCIPLVGVVMMIFAAIRLLLKISKEYIGEEGFWGIFIAIGVVGLRFAILFLFQWQ